jgi:Flp pilus assembly protein TadD
MVDLGLLHLKHGRAARAFTLFGSALTYDPSDAKVSSGVCETWRPP